MLTERMDSKNEARLGSGQEEGSILRLPRASHRYRERDPNRSSGKAGAQTVTLRTHQRVLQGDTTTLAPSFGFHQRHRVFGRAASDFSRASDRSIVTQTELIEWPVPGKSNLRNSLLLFRVLQKRPSAMEVTTQRLFIDSAEFQEQIVQTLILRCRCRPGKWTKANRNSVQPLMICTITSCHESKRLTFRQSLAGEPSEMDFKFHTALSQISLLGDESSLRIPERRRLKATRGLAQDTRGDSSARRSRGGALEVPRLPELVSREECGWTATRRKAVNYTNASHCKHL